MSLVARTRYRTPLRATLRSPLPSQGGLNLVPLVDVLTAIVFFSLLSYSGAMALASIDLTLPPAANLTGGAVAPAPVRPAALVVRVDRDGVVLRTADEPTGTAFAGDSALRSLGDALSALHATVPAAPVVVVPSDDVPYERVVRVLERVRLANFAEVSLAPRERVGRARQGGH